MDQALEVVVEMAESIWEGFRRALEDITPAEVNWRPLPEGNSISLIVRHLRIEAQWHRACLERGEPMPHETTENLQRQIDSVTLDYDGNLKALEEAYAGFLRELRGMTLGGLKEQTQAAYKAWPSSSPHFLGFHQAMHLATHWGQIRTIRNLYCKTRGEPARFFPDNPSYPRGEAG